MRSSYGKILGAIGWNLTKLHCGKLTDAASATPKVTLLAPRRLRAVT